MAQSDNGSMVYSSSSQGSGPVNAAAALENPMSDFSMPSSGSSQNGDQNQLAVMLGSVPPMPHMATVGEDDPLDNEVRAALAGSVTLAASSSQENSSLSNSTNTSWSMVPEMAPTIFGAVPGADPATIFGGGPATPHDCTDA